MNALEWNRDLTRPIAEIRAREAAADRPARSRQQDGVLRRRCAAAASGCAWHADRALRCAGQSVTRVALPGAGLGADTGAARLVSRHGGARRDGQITDRDAVSTRKSQRWTNGTAGRCTPIGYVLSLEGADSILTLAHLERAYAQGLRAVGPGALRSRRLRPGHGCDRRAWDRAARNCCARWSGWASSSTRRTSATTASATRWTTSAARSGRATRTAARSSPHNRQFSRRAHQGAHRARRRHRRGVRRLDDRAGLGARRARRPRTPASRSSSSSTTSITSARSPATRGTA